MDKKINSILIHGNDNVVTVTNKFKLEDINDVANKLDKRQIKGRWVISWD